MAEILAAQPTFFLEVCGSGGEIAGFLPLVAGGSVENLEARVVVEKEKGQVSLFRE